MKNINTAIENAPTMTMHITCFHKEKRTYTDKEGKKSTKMVSVVTHSASAPFEFEWLDKSPPPETLKYLDVLHLIRLETKKIITMSPKAYASY